MNSIAVDAEPASMPGPADPEHLHQTAEHQRARRAAKRGLMWLGLVYLGFLGSGVSIAVGHIVGPLGL